MKTLQQQNQGTQLILYFTGWGTPPSVVKHLVLPSNTDLAICYQYHDLSCPIDFNTYTSIRIIAWSMGIWVAERVCHSYHLYPLLKSATAINGTGLPRHPHYGISPRLFDITVNTLSPKNRQHFEQSMCHPTASNTILAQYQNAPDYRHFDDVSHELVCLQQWILEDTRTDLVPWTNAILSIKDHIFPIENMRNYWQSRCPITEIDGAHLIFPLFTHWEYLWS